MIIFFLSSHHVSLIFYAESAPYPVKSIHQPSSPRHQPISHYILGSRVHFPSINLVGRSGQLAYIYTTIRVPNCRQKIKRQTQRPVYNCIGNHMGSPVLLLTKAVLQSRLSPLRDVATGSTDCQRPRVTIHATPE